MIIYIFISLENESRTVLLAEVLLNLLKHQILGESGPTYSSIFRWSNKFWSQHPRGHTSIQGFVRWDAIGCIVTEVSDHLLDWPIGCHCCRQWFTEAKESQDHEEIDLARWDLEEFQPLRDIESLEGQGDRQKSRHDEILEGSGMRLKHDISYPLESMKEGRRWKLIKIPALNVLNYYLLGS